MNGISGVSTTPQMPVRPPVNRVAPEGSATEEAHESPAEKAREQQSASQTASPPMSSASGVGQTINVMG
jgi:hypothetical protein